VAGMIAQQNNATVLGSMPYFSTSQTQLFIIQAFLNIYSSLLLLDGKSIHIDNKSSMNTNENGVFANNDSTLN
jgi:hypothetical protein